MSGVRLPSIAFNVKGIFVFMDGSENLGEILHFSNSKNDLAQFLLEIFSELILSITLKL